MRMTKPKPYTALSTSERGGEESGPRQSDVEAAMTQRGTSLCQLMLAFALVSFLSACVGSAVTFHAMRGQDDGPEYSGQAVYATAPLDAPTPPEYLTAHPSPPGSPPPQSSPSAFPSPSAHSTPSPHARAISSSSLPSVPQSLSPHSPTSSTTRLAISPQEPAVTSPSPNPAVAALQSRMDSHQKSIAEMKMRVAGMENNELGQEYETAFPINLDDIECRGTRPVGRGVTTLEECRDLCENSDACGIWQWFDTNPQSGMHAPNVNRCHHGPEVPIRPYYDSWTDCNALKVGLKSRARYNNTEAEVGLLQDEGLAPNTSVPASKQPIVLIFGVKDTINILKMAMKRLNWPGWQTYGVIGDPDRQLGRDDSAVASIDLNSHIVTVPADDDYRSYHAKYYRAVAAIRKFFPDAPGVFKIDDDVVFLDSRLFPRIVNNHTRTWPDYWGVEHCGSFPYGYCFGVGFFLSPRSMDIIIAYKRDLMNDGAIEDINTGYILCHQAGLPVPVSQRFPFVLNQLHFYRHAIRDSEKIIDDLKRQVQVALSHSQSPSLSRSQAPTPSPVPAFTVSRFPGCEAVPLFISQETFTAACTARLFPDLEVPAMSEEPSVLTSTRGKVQAFWRQKHQPLTQVIVWDRGPQTILPMSLIVHVEQPRDLVKCAPDLLHTIATKLVGVPDEILMIVSGFQSISPADRAAAQEFMKFWEGCIPELSFVIRQQEHTMGSNMNLGAYMARYEVISFFDGDGLPHPNRFSLIYRAFHERPDLHYLLTYFTNARWADPVQPADTADSTPPYRWEYTTVRTAYRDLHIVSPGTYKGAESVGLGPCHHGWMSLRKQVWREIPFGLDGSAQDVQYLNKVALSAFNVSMIDRRLGNHHEQMPKACGQLTSGVDFATCPSA